MEALLFHPKLVHVPMALGVLMPFIALGLLLAWRRGWLPPRAWWVAVALQGVLLASGVVALRSGEAEEDRVESVVAEAQIEAHEEAAQVFVLGSAVVLAMMLGAGVLAARGAGLPAAAAATVGTLVVLGLGYRTGQAGGELVYRHGAAAAYTSGAAPNAAGANDGARTRGGEEREDD